MTWERDRSKSLRENILAHFKDRFENVRADENGFTTTWDQVERAPLTRQDKLQDATVSLLGTREVKKEVIGAMECTLTVVIEFSFKVLEGDEPETELNRLLLDIYRTMRLDIQAGGMVLNIVERSSQLDLDGPEDRVVGGVVFWEVLYRHAIDDPRRLRGEKP